MIWTASYFRPKHHHGQVVSVSLSEPKGWKGERLSFLAPTPAILTSYKRDPNPARYEHQYRELLAHRWHDVKNWLWNLGSEDLTLCCWEQPGDFCHRNLIFKMIERHRVELVVGMDTPFHFGDRVEAWDGFNYQPGTWLGMSSDRRHRVRGTNGKLFNPAPFLVKPMQEVKNGS